MAHFPHSHLRGSIWWWRRAFTVAAGRQVLVALSLRTRDRKEAQRLCRRANVTADDLMETMGSPTAANLKAAIQGALFQTRLDTDERTRDNLRYAATLDGDKRHGELGMLALTARRHAHLYDVAASFGPITRCTGAVDEYLKAKEVSWMDADWVASKIEKGYAANLYTSAGEMTGAPPQEHLARRLEEDGCEATAPAVSEAYRAHAAGRAAQERAAAETYALAKSDLGKAFARLAPEPPFTRTKEIGWPAPPWSGIDDMRRGKIEIAPSVMEAAARVWASADGLNKQEAATLLFGSPPAGNGSASAAEEPVDEAADIVQARSPASLEELSQATPGDFSATRSSGAAESRVRSGLVTRKALNPAFPWDDHPILTTATDIGRRASLCAAYTLGGLDWTKPEPAPTPSNSPTVLDIPKTGLRTDVDKGSTSIGALVAGSLGRIPAGAERPPLMRPHKRHGVVTPMAVVTPLTQISTLPEVVEALIAKRSKESSKRGKKREPKWDVKTADQHRGIAQMFVSVVGSINLKDIEIEHVPLYFRTLEALSRTLGRSSRDHLLSLEEHLANAAELDGDKVGRDAGTVNRQVTQLGNILASARSYGSKLDGLKDALEEERQPAEESNKLPFTCDDITALLQHEAFVHTLSKASPSLYWITLLAVYTGARMAELCGLRVSDIDGAVIVIRKNPYRRLKNKGATRRIPLHPELIRLGFLDYLATIAASGSDLLFPDLRARGVYSSLSNLFSKEFTPLLDAALANARQEGKTFHSLRHSFNSILIGKADPVVRYRLMGHTTTDAGDQLDVNARVYSHLADDLLSAAIEQIPKYSSHLQPRSWQVG